MHITFRSTLLASSMLLACTLHAGVADGLNINELPAFNTIDLDGSSSYSPVTWSYNEVYFEYVPTFSYTLTGIYTRFSEAGLGAHSVNLGVYNYNPLTGSGSGPLVSLSVSLIPGTVDIVPGPDSLNTGTEWLGGNGFPSLNLTAGTSYFIGLSGLVGDGWSAGVNTVHFPNEASSTALINHTFSTTSALTYARGALNPQSTTQPPINVLYTDPIFKFEGPGVTPVPEPSTYGLFGAVGLLGFSAYRRRFGRKS